MEINTVHSIIVIAPLWYFKIFWILVMVVMKLYSGQQFQWVWKRVSSRDKILKLDVELLLDGLP